MNEYIAVGIIDYRAQGSNIYNKVKAVFSNNHLKLLSMTNNEVRGQNKKKKYFILALFSSISEARTFENQAAKARKKGVFEIKTQRMDHKKTNPFH